MLLWALFLCLLGCLSWCSEDLKLSIKEMECVWNRAYKQVLVYGRVSGSDGPYLRLVDDYAELFMNSASDEGDSVKDSKLPAKKKKSRFVYPNESGKNLELLFVKRSFVPSCRSADEIRPMMARKATVYPQIYELKTGLESFMDTVWDALMTDELCVCVAVSLTSVGFTLQRHVPSIFEVAISEHISPQDTAESILGTLERVLGDGTAILGEVVTYMLGSPFEEECSHEFLSTRFSGTRLRITNIEHLEAFLIFCKTFTVEPTLHLATTEEHKRVTGEGIHDFVIFHPGRDLLSLKFLFATILDGTLQTALKTEIVSIFFNGFLPDSMNELSIKIRFGKPLRREDAALLLELYFSPARLGYFKNLEFGCVDEGCSGACCCSRAKAVRMTPKRPVYIRVNKGDSLSPSGPVPTEEPIQMGEAGSFSQASKMIKNYLRKAKNLRALSLGNILPLMHNPNVIHCVCPMTKALDILLLVAEKTIYTASDLGVSVESVFFRQQGQSDALLAVVLRKNATLSLEQVLAILNEIKLPIKLSSPWSILKDKMYAMTAKGDILLGKFVGERNSKTCPSMTEVNTKSIEAAKARLQSAIETNVSEKKTNNKATSARKPAIKVSVEVQQSEKSSSAKQSVPPPQEKQLNVPRDDRVTVSSTQMCSCETKTAGKEVRVALYYGPVDGPVSFITNDAREALFSDESCLTIPQSLLQPTETWSLTLIEDLGYVYDTTSITGEVEHELELASNFPLFYHLKSLLASVTPDIFVRFTVGPKVSRAQFCRINSRPKCAPFAYTGYLALSDSNPKGPKLPVARTPAEYLLVAPWSRTDVSWYNMTAPFTRGPRVPLGFLIRFFHSRLVPAHLADQFVIYLMEEEKALKLFPAGVNNFRMYSSALIPGNFCAEVTLNGEDKPSVQQTLSSSLLSAVFAETATEHIFTLTKLAEDRKSSPMADLPDFSLLVDDIPRWMQRLDSGWLAAMTYSTLCDVLNAKQRAAVTVTRADIGPNEFAEDRSYRVNLTHPQLVSCLKKLIPAITSRGTVPFWVFCLHSINFGPYGLRKHQSRGDQRNWSLRFNFIGSRLISGSELYLLPELTAFIENAKLEEKPKKEEQVVAETQKMASKEEPVLIEEPKITATEESVPAETPKIALEKEEPAMIKTPEKSLEAEKPVAMETPKKSLKREEPAMIEAPKKTFEEERPLSIKSAKRILKRQHSKKPTVNETPMEIDTQPLLETLIEEQKEIATVPVESNGEPKEIASAAVIIAAVEEPTLPIVIPSIPELELPIGDEEADKSFLRGLDTLLDTLRHEAESQATRIQEVISKITTESESISDNLKGKTDEELEKLTSNVQNLKNHLEGLSKRNRALKEAIEENVGVPLIKEAALIIEGQKTVVLSLAQVFSTLGSTCCTGGTLWTFFPDSANCSLILPKPGSGYQIFAKTLDISESILAVGVFVSALELWHVEPSLFALLLNFECSIDREKKIAIFTAHVDFSRSGKPFLETLYHIVFLLCLLMPV